jgi:DNA-directed RNA polymerase subunit N (RpoN/RPB10)
MAARKPISREFLASLSPEQEALYFFGPRPELRERPALPSREALMALPSEERRRLVAAARRPPEPLVTPSVSEAFFRGLTPAQLQRYREETGYPGRILELVTPEEQKYRAERIRDDRARQQRLLAGAEERVARAEEDLAAARAAREAARPGGGEAAAAEEIYATAAQALRAARAARDGQLEVAEARARAYLGEKERSLGFLSEGQRKAYDDQLMLGFYETFGSDPLGLEELGRRFRLADEGDISDEAAAELWDRLERPSPDDLEALHLWAGGKSYEEDLQLARDFGADLARLRLARRGLGLGGIPAVLRAFLATSDYPHPGGAQPRASKADLDRRISEYWGFVSPFDPDWRAAEEKQPAFAFGQEFLLEAASALERFGGPGSDLEATYGPGISGLRNLWARRERELESLGREHIPFIRCPSCGKVLGAITKLYQGMEMFYRRELETRRDVEARDISVLWKSLGVTRYCCMARIANPPLLPHKSGESWVPAGVFRAAGYPAPEGERGRGRAVLSNLSVTTEQQIETIVPDFRTVPTDEAMRQPLPSEEEEEERAAEGRPPPPPRKFEGAMTLPSGARRVVGEEEGLPSGPAAHLVPSTRRRPIDLQLPEGVGSEGHASAAIPSRQATVRTLVLPRR